MQHLATQLVFLLLIGYICVVTSLKVFNIAAPENPQVGSEITLTCNYDKHNDVMHAIHWYYNHSQEFYRFVPQTEPPRTAFFHEGFRVNLKKSDDRQVTISNITSAANGTYSCSVDMEAPTFASDYVYKQINVQDKPLIPLNPACNSEKEHFRPSKSYFFKYELAATSYAPITTTGQSGFFIFCEVQLDANETCHYMLNVTSCGIKHHKDGPEHPKSNEFSTAIARFPVQFSMFNGTIGEVVAHEDETLHLLNFKRGIISALLAKRYPSNTQNDHEYQIRTDVHGTCPVTYNKNISEWWIHKDMSQCHFPSRIDWPYSPLSLIWNTSTILLQVINHRVVCDYSYNPDGNLEETKCIEHYSVKVTSGKRSGTEVEVLIAANLTLKDDRNLTSWAKDKLNLAKYHQTGIQYEYERVAKPTENPQLFVNKVVALLSELPTDPEKEIDPETANIFDRLIDLLRKSPDLSVLEYDNMPCWTSPICRNTDAKNSEIQKGQIWRNALIQCNTAPCTRAFRTMLSMNPKYLRYVVSKTDLHLIFLTWTNAKIDDIEHIREFLEITKMRPDDRFLLTALASIVHDYWSRHRTAFRANIPPTLREFVQLILKPIGQNCTPSLGFKDADIRATLQAITNLGPLFQKLHPIYVYTFENCITNEKAHWSTSSMAIQATRNMEPTNDLRNFLFRILNNPVLKHEDHAAAYFILVKKFGGAKLVADILELLEKTLENGQNQNLRTLIATHMRTVAKTWDPNKLKFVKAVREAMVHKSNLFRAIPEEKFVTRISADHPYMQKIPWGIHLDDDLKFAEGYFSKYEEISYKFISPLLPDILKEIWYKLNSSSLHNEDSYLAYATWLESQAYGLGHIFKGNHLSVITKGVMNLVQKMTQYTENEKPNMATFYSIYQNAQEYLQNAKTSQQPVRVSKGDFPHNIDEAILQSLANLHNERVQAKLNRTTKRDVVLQFGSFAPMTMEEFSKAKNEFLYDLREKFLPPHNAISNYWKIVEAAAELPTLAGLPLRWTTDAYLINNFKLDGELGNREFKIDGSFSAIGTLKQGIILELPKFTSCGAQMFTTVSTSLGAAIDLSWNLKNFHVHLELPQRPMQLFSFKRTITLINKYHAEATPEYQEVRDNENWCLYTLAPLTGFKICHSHSHVDVSEDSSRACSMLAGDSHWNYTAVYIARHKAAFQFAVEVKENMYNSHAHSFEAELKSRDTLTGYIFHTVMKLSHKVNSVKREFETEVLVPIMPSFSIKVTKEPLKRDGFHIKADLNIYPWKTTHIDYMKKITEENLAESSMKSHLTTNSSRTLIKVKTSETTYNYKSPTAFYEVSHRCHTFPRTTYSDTVFVYKSLQFPMSSWVRAAFNHDMFWENNKSASVNIHQEVKFTCPRGLLPEESYTTFVLPKKIYTMTTLNRITPSRESTNNYTSTFKLNISASDPTTHHLLDYFNFSNILQNKYEDGTETTLLDINATMPLFSCAMQVLNSHHYTRPYDKNLTLILRREALKVPPGSIDWQRWASNANAVQSWVSSVKLTFGVRDMCDSCNMSSLSIANRELSSSFHYIPDEQYSTPFEIYILSTPTFVSTTENIYKRNCSISIPLVATTIDGQLHFLNSSYSKMLLWTAVVHLPNEPKIDYSFNITPAIRTEGRIYMMESLNSDTYKRNSRLVLNIVPTTTLDFNITAVSPAEPLLAMDLQLRIADEKAKLKVVHTLLVIDGEVNWRNGYQHLFNVKSKDQDFVPNIQWKANLSQNSKANLELRLNENDAFYTYARTELNATRLMLDTCYQPNCTFDPDSENFVAQIEWSLENPQELARTVIYNPKIMREISHHGSERFSMIKMALNSYFRASERESPILKWKKIALNTLNNMAWRTQAFIAPFDRICVYFRNSIDVVSLVVKNSKDYFSTESQNPETYFCWTKLRNVFSSSNILNRENIPLFRGYYDLVTEYLSLHWYKPGPVPGRSYVTTISLPVYWTQFNHYPLQYSPALFRMFSKFKENPYHDEKYTRHALLVSTGDVYTFDGKVLHLQQQMSGQCTYLLSHDFEELKFSIYYHDFKVHFILPEMSLTIGLTGYVALNHTLRTDFPIESWNRNVRVTRQSNLIELTTPYNLKAICNVKDFYCLIYTNGFKFNQVIGLLGNNNDNPKDDSKDPSRYELSGVASCRHSTFLLPTPSTNVSTIVFRWHDLIWNSLSATLPCHDIISPREFFVPAYLQDPFHFPCPLMNGYLALCGSKGIKSDSNPCS